MVYLLDDSDSFGTPNRAPGRPSRLKGARPRKWSDCYNALMSACRDHGLRVSIVTYGVAIENWPTGALSHEDFGHLRIGLNAIGKVV